MTTEYDQKRIRERRAKIDAYKDCMDILRNLADTAEYKNGSVENATVLRDAMLLIHRRRDALLRVNLIEETEPLA